MDGEKLVTKKKSLNTDEVLEEVGSLGKFQALLIAVLGFCLYILTFQPFLLNFIALEPPWRCVNHSVHCNFTTIVQRSNRKLYPYRCSIPRSAWTFVGPYQTTVTEWNLVCEKAPLVALAYSLLPLGNLFGLVIFGILGDKFGRKRLIFSSAFFIGIFSIGSALSPEFWFFSLSRFVIGILGAGAVIPMFTTVAEFSGVRHRSTASTMLWLIFALSLCTLPLLAWLIVNWRILTLVVSVPVLVLLVAWRWVPESARWLMVKGREKEARVIFKHMAKINGRVLPDIPLEVVREDPQSANVRDLFRNREVSKSTLVQWLAWIANAFVYSGVTFNAGTLGGSLYLNFALQAVSEIPGNVLAIWTMNKFGRKCCVILGMIMAALASISTASMSSNDTVGFVIGRVIMATVAKFMIVASYAGIYVLSTELFPTVIRNIGVGSCVAVSAAGYFSASYVMLLQDVNRTLPFGIMGVTSLICGLLCIVLPETKDRPTPDYLDNGVPEKREQPAPRPLPRELIMESAI